MIKDVNENEIKIGDKCYFPYNNMLLCGVVLDVIIKKNEKVNEFGLTFDKIISIKDKINEIDNLSIPSPKLYIGYDIVDNNNFLTTKNNMTYNNFIIVEPNNVIKK